MVKTKAVKIEKPVEPAYRALVRTLGLMRRVMEPFFARHGISAAQWSVLRALHRAKEEGLDGVRLCDLSDRLFVRPPSVTGIVDRLQRMELVTRLTSQVDQRSKLVRLTVPGRQLVDRILQGHAQRVQHVLGALRGVEQRELTRLLDRLGDHLEALTEHGENGLGSNGN